MRVPTYDEWEQLVAFQVDRVYKDPKQEDWEQERENVKNIWACVFEDYITDGPGYAGRVMVVVWGGSPSFTETFIWQRYPQNGGYSEPKLTKVEVES